MLSGGELTAERVADEIEALRARLADGLEGALPEPEFDLRYRGQAFELTIPGPADPDPAKLTEAFEAEHERRYGHRGRAGDVELVNVRLALAAEGPQLAPAAAPSGSLERSSRRARFAGEWLEAEVLRGEPSAGIEAEGPCVLELPEATLVLPPGWRAGVDEQGTILARRTG